MNIALTVLTRTIGAIQIAGWSLLLARAAVEVKHNVEQRIKRRNAGPHIDTIEDQLDIMIHTSEIDEACGYCGTSQNPNDMCRTCFDNL